MRTRSREWVSRAPAALLAAIVLLVSGLVGCGPRYDLDAIRARSDDMAAEILDAYYRTDAYGEQSDLVAIWERYADLADPGLPEHIAGLRDRETEPRERKRLDYLFFDAASTLVYEDLITLEDEISNIEATGVVVVGGDSIAYRDIGVLFYNETDSELRRRYYEAMGEFEVRHLNPLRARMVAETRSRLEEFGFANLDEFEADRRNLDHAAFEETVLDLLGATRDIYWDLTNDASREIFGVDVTEIPDYDRGRLFRGAEFDRHFAAEDMMPLMERTFLGMGIDIGSLPIHVDDEDRPGKEPRAATYGIRPGKDVRILLKPAGGVDDYETLFHEMGHGIHDAVVRVTEYEFQRLGDYGVTETYAYLPEQLFMDPLFLIENGLITDDEVLGRFLKNQLLGSLGSARYYAGLFRYERYLHAGDHSQDELVRAYGRFMEESRLVPLAHPEYDYLSSNEDYYGVNYLEAWILAAQLRHVLRERFGDRWWASEQAGELWVELMEYGAELTAVEVARHVGFDGLDASYYVEEVTRAYEAYR